MIVNDFSKLHAKADVEPLTTDQTIILFKNITRLLLAFGSLNPIPGSLQMTYKGLFEVNEVTGQVRIE